MKDFKVKNFALIGAAGYIAPRHMNAIKQTNNNMICALDTNDSVGIIDNYFPEANFFKEFERFDRYVDKIRREDKHIDYVSICSPNYLHDAHIRFALRNSANAICEKPLVLNPYNIDALRIIEEETSKKIYTILQLRLHKNIVELKEKIKKELEKNPNKIYEVDLSYITSRGKWYFVSWKGDESKSGGLATNIGIHFFDMLYFLFGEVEENLVFIKTDSLVSGYLKLKNAKVKWLLSIDINYIPKEFSNKRTYRSIKIDDIDLEFSEGFEDLHTLSYKNILNGYGFGLDEAKISIEIVKNIRTQKLSKDPKKIHPFLKK